MFKILRFVLIVNLILMMFPQQIKNSELSTLRQYKFEIWESSFLFLQATDPKI